MKSKVPGRNFFFDGVCFNSSIFEKWTALGLFLFASFYLFFYPPIYTFLDEASYFSMAYVLKSGHLFMENLSIPVPTWIFMKGRKIFDYPPGMALLLVPLTGFGWKSFFVTGLAFHSLGAVYFSKLLKTFDIQRPYLVFLYLFYPAFVFYSRTLMSDLPAATLFLAGLYYYYGPRCFDWRGSVFWGISLLIRPTTVIFILPFAGRNLLRAIKTEAWGALVLFLAPMLLSGLILTGYHKILLGSFFLTPYSQEFSVLKNFSLEYFLPNLTHYLKSLNLTYPVMLLSVFAARKTRRSEIVLSIVIGILFFSFYYFHDKFKTPLETCSLGNRFLFPAVSLIILMSAEVLNYGLNRLSAPIKALCIGFTAVSLLSSTVFIHRQHQEALTKQASWVKLIYQTASENSILIYDGSVAKFLQAEWGQREYVFFRDGEKSLTEFLRSADFNRGVFIIKKSDFPGPFSLAWAAPEESQKLSAHYSPKIAAKNGLLEIYQIYEKNT